MGELGEEEAEIGEMEEVAELVGEERGEAGAGEGDVEKEGLCSEGESDREESERVRGEGAWKKQKMNEHK